MIVVITGSRSITDRAFVYRAIEESLAQYDVHPEDIELFVSGNAWDGVDRIGEAWAEAHGIQIVLFPANWKRFHKRAGHIRNEKMASFAAMPQSDQTMVIAIWDGVSPGTKGMIDICVQKGLFVVINEYPDNAA